MAFTLIKKEGNARRGRFVTPHGVIETPVFMNVGTCAAIRGGVSTMDLRELGCHEIYDEEENLTAIDFTEE